jgi:hypothetical protein
MNDAKYFTDAEELGTAYGLDPQKSRRLLPARSLLDAFDKQRPAGLWTHINRTQLSRELRARILDPNTVDQASANLCGVVSVIRTWAFDFPLEYTRFALDLYTRGKAQMIGRSARMARVVSPSTDLRHAPPPQGMAHADWIVAASVRESLNRVFDYSPGEGIFSIKAWTLPSDVERELKSLGYIRVRNKANVAQSSGYETLMEASQLYQSNRSGPEKPRSFRSVPSS